MSKRTQLENDYIKAYRWLFGNDYSIKFIHKQFISCPISRRQELVETWKNECKRSFNNRDYWD